MRFIKPLEAGASYRNYVKMIPSEEKGTWTGDVYILEDEIIIGMVGQIKFRQFPRMLMDRFFSPNKGGHAPAGPSTAAASAGVPPVKVVKPADVPKVVAAPSPAVPTATATTVQQEAPQPRPVAEPQVEAKDAVTTKEENPMIANVMNLIASETGLDRSEFTDDTVLASIGVDSLMSLVLVEKFKTQLKLDIKSSLFLECSTIGEFREWIEENR